MHSEPVSIIYVFNLIVGAGALTLPQAFAETGLILGIIAIFVLGIISFITSTFMVEAMSLANAIEKLNVVAPEITSEDSSINKESDERTALLHSVGSDNHGTRNIYDITNKKELGEMAKIFFNSIGVKLFYIVIAVYLYGDLAIYAAAVPKSLALVTCSHLKHVNSSRFDPDTPCFSHLNSGAIYRLYLLAFTLTLGPFAFFDLGKTKYLQLLTTFFRWLAFLLMISLALYGIGNHQRNMDITMVKFSRLPNFFGVSVYSFMCQHSLPSILTPTKRKTRLQSLLSVSFSMVTCFYLLLTTTAVFRFKTDEIVDIYTLNFLNSQPYFAYFLALFPVFTLSTNFPIIAITLRENLKTIFNSEGRHCCSVAEKFLYPFLTIAPPIAIAFITQNVEVLVEITGSYPGAVIQYVVPVMLVYCGRKKVKELTGVYINQHRSFFRQTWWIYFVLGWTVVCIVLVSVNYGLQD